MPKKSKPNKKDNKFKGSKRGGAKVNSDSDADASDIDLYDEIDKFHSNRDKIPLDAERKDTFSSEEEEILPIVSDSASSDDEEYTSYKAQLQKLRRSQVKQKKGDSSKDEEEGIPDRQAWGKNRSNFYRGDVVDQDIDLSGSEGEEGKAALEEKEAAALQKKMLEGFDDNDFNFDLFQSSQDMTEEKEDKKIEKDLSEMTEEEQRELLKKQSPELFPLIEELIGSMTKLTRVILPVFTLYEQKKLPPFVAKYVDDQRRTNLLYSMNILFYLTLKSKQKPTKNHPVMKRIFQFRQILKKFEDGDDFFKDLMATLAEKVDKGQEVEFQPSMWEFDENGEKMKSQESAERKRKSKKQRSDKKKKAKLEERQDESNISEESETDEDMEEEGTAVVAAAAANDEDDLDPDGKRAITYQMEKNKGLTAHKRKELRNPRVKHRMKYRKAKIRRRGQIREVRTEVKRYQGETSGIRSGVVKSVRFK